MSKKRIIILGAGLAGLSAAWHLQRKSIPSRTFEKERAVGGLCRSQKQNGFTFDCSGHSLHFRHSYTLSLVRKLLGNRLVQHNRSAWVYSFGRYTRYPFQANLYGLPSKIAAECLKGFIRARRTGSFKTNNFSHWILQTFGTGIARHFMIPYNTKFWRVSPQRLTCEWLDRMIPVPSLNQVLEGARKESTRQLGYNAHFWYPRGGGISQLPEAFARQIKQLSTGSKVVKIDLAKKEVKMDSGRKEKFDYLISTIPLPEMASLIFDLPKDLQTVWGRLRWNSVFNLNLGGDLKGDFGQHWAYFPHRDTCFFRVGFFHNFSSDLTPAGKRSLYAEVSYSKSNPLVARNRIPIIERDLRAVGILSLQDGISARNINDIEYGYPIYDQYYHKSVEIIKKFLVANQIMPCGRYGSWRYMSMEDAILDGKRAAESV